MTLSAFRGLQTNTSDFRATDLITVLRPIDVRPAAREETIVLDFIVKARMNIWVNQID